MLRLFREAACLTAAALAAACSLHAAAGVFDEDARREVRDLRTEMDRKVADLDTQIKMLDGSIKSLGIIQLLNQIEQLNSEIAKLRGQSEIFANQNDLLVKRQRDFYLDLDTRLRKLEGLAIDGRAPAVGGQTPSAQSPR